MRASTHWVVQRFEPSPSNAWGQIPMSPVGEPQTFFLWREVCKAVTLAIGSNSLDENDSPAEVTVFERDGVVIVVYMKLEI